ncbi:MAG TPA: protein arginine kinase [Thermoanaerobacterales bacterium]|nr:protein arginine kinase [Thermoanaerobacterales bacterium]
MPLEDFIKESAGKWMDGDGPESDTVISSRVRLARNLSEIPFPYLMSKEDSEEITKKVNKVLQENSPNEFELVTMRDLSFLARKALVEKHLISPSLADNDNGAAIIRYDEVVSIMVNEEDHLRIQTLFSGQQLEKAWQLCNKIDDILEARLNYAFSEQMGYLTSCPTNVGTGIRVSVMVHLPALIMTGQLNRIFSTISQVGLTVRGLYGEGTQAIGNIYQISNQITLGQTESEIIENLNGVTKQIIEQERAVREVLLKERKAKLCDKIGRSYGIISNAYIISSEEAIQLLSDVRLGVELGLLENINLKMLNELMILIRSAYLQELAGKELSPYERDVRRAEIIRNRFAELDLGGV